MASIPCFNLFMPIDGCDPSWTIEATKVRLNSSDLDGAFRDLMAANWLVDGYETLSIGRNSARAVMILRKLGFPDAMGLYRSCASLFRHRRQLRALPFHDGSFDFVFSTEMIDGVRVPARLVLEMERVLKPARVGVVMRRVSENFPMTAIMKAAAPVAAFLRFSDVVAVRTVNCTVLVVFKKRTMVAGLGHENHKAMEQKKVLPGDIMTKIPRDSTGNCVGTNATPSSKADLSVARKSLRGPITEMPRDSAVNNVGTYGTLTKQQPLSEAGFGVNGNSARALITETPRKSVANGVAAYATLKKGLLPETETGKSAGNLITEMPRDSAGSHLGAYSSVKKRYLLNMPPFGTKKRYGNGG
ncbi:uncharacterized protein LOC122069253 isoform X2 [Macadamia integrifolia]|nr:uncharacterized protein LOC122069253 isoform X2 [Macadamia integrifolia]